MCVAVALKGHAERQPMTCIAASHLIAWKLLQHFRHDVVNRCAHCSLCCTRCKPGRLLGSEQSGQGHLAVLQEALQSHQQRGGQRGLGRARGRGSGCTSTSQLPRGPPRDGRGTGARTQEAFNAVLAMALASAQPQIMSSAAAKPSPAAAPVCCCCCCS